MKVGRLSDAPEVRCENCACWQQIATLDPGQTSGLCRANPPQSGMTYKWPVTASKDWCAKFFRIVNDLPKPEPDINEFT